MAEAGFGTQTMAEEIVPSPDDAVLLSVIIPTYRREAQLVRAIRSVLDEGIDSLEVLVFDDSPEGSARFAVAGVNDPRVRYSVMNKPTGGVPATVRNRGIAESNGEILYFLDDDDIIATGGLSTMVHALEEEPSAGVAFGTVACFGPDDGVVESYNQWFRWAGETAQKFRRSSWLTVGIAMFRGTVIINSACCLRRSVALELEGYDAEIPLYEDVEFFLRAMRASGHIFVNQPVLQYSTGLPSLIHDLDGEVAGITKSYEIMHSKYRETNGVVEYRALQICSKLLPLSSPEGRSV